MRPASYPTRAGATAALVLVAALAGCGDDGGTAARPLFPEDYAASYAEVRNCRRSLDHDIQYIRILASPEALAPYQDRDAPFPVGAVVLKEQYSEIDTTCEGEVVQYTVMRRLADGAAPTTLDWEWQRVDADLVVDEDEEVSGCASCHAECVAPDGYDGTCAVP